MLRLAIDAPPGHFVELGVYQGGTAVRLAMLAAMQGRECHLFDTFCGVPEATPGVDITPIGQFADTDAEIIRRMIPTAIIHVGVFPDTMPNLDGIAFVHVDFEQYRSNLAAIDRFYPLLVKGGVMLFDDYNVTLGARRAVEGRFGIGLERTREGKALVRRT